jgi:2-dehydropantoate 2-reductase
MSAYHVVGAGGIGCAVGHALLQSGASVVFVETNPTKLEAGRRMGVGVVGQPHRPAPFVAFDDWQPPTGAVILLCTKCFDNPAVLERLPSSSALVPIQNGFDPLLDRRSHRVEAIASFVSECEPDQPLTRITRTGDLHLGGRGRLEPADQRIIDDLSNLLRSSRLFRLRTVSDIRPFKHTKLLYNAAISPLASAAGIDNGSLLSDPLARRLFFALLRENFAILRRARVPLGTIGPFHPDIVQRILGRPWVARLFARFLQPSLRGTYCSMSGDLPRGRTEILNYTGHLVGLAQGQDCRLNQALLTLVQRIERERLTPGAWALNELACSA